jgi:Fe-S-cluster containining protein
MDKITSELFKLQSDYNNKLNEIGNQLNTELLERLTRFNMQPEKVNGGFAAELAKWYEKIINHAVSIITQWEEESNLRHTCQTSCTCCCHQLIEVYNYEVLVIMAYLKSSGQLHLVKETGALSNFVKEQLPYNYFELDEADSINYKIHYRSLKIPCLFKIDGKCVIYKVRPSCCAAYFSYGPARECEDCSSVPAGCVNFDMIEEWIVEQILIFIKHNRDNVPTGFNPFEMAVLPVAISDLLKL